jgi:hypothetical protein
MIRTIFVPHNDNVNFPIPQEYIGKELEIIVFPIEEVSKKSTFPQKVTFTDFGLDAPDYKFDREEAEDLQHNQLIDNTLSIINPFIN